MKKYFIFAVMLCSVAGVKGATDADEVCDHIDVRAGYNVGGTMPLSMPASIRSLNKYSLQPNITVGADYEHKFTRQWGVQVGVNFENKGMKTDAQVKTYHMKMVKGTEEIEGYFTGNVITKVERWQFTVPLDATFWAHRNVKIKVGPYVSFAASQEFSGTAYDGYLRQNTPVGPRIDIGSEPGERGDYDFSDDLRTVNWGIDAGVDWYLRKNLGVYAGVTVGMNNAFKSGFSVIEQSMHPVYGSIGVLYRIK